MEEEQARPLPQPVLPSYLTNTAQELRLTIEKEKDRMDQDGKCKWILYCLID